jgi:hypothetical protein
VDPNHRANLVLVLGYIFGGRQAIGSGGGHGAYLDLNQFRLDLGTYAFALE